MMSVVDMVAAAVAELSEVIQTLLTGPEFATQCPGVYAKWLLARGFVVAKTAEAWKADESSERRVEVSDIAWVEVSLSSDSFYRRVFGKGRSMNTIKGVIEE
jgi:hypothetical protein